jgi:TRAP-type C4-dicarboxylate transport system substrate-binding protein
MRRRQSRTSASILIATFVVALIASACSDGRVDKAGGTRTTQPVVLTLADHETSPVDVQLWIEEVQRRSGGSLHIQVTNQWRNQEANYDKGTIADVQAGKVQLAKVAARAYDTVSVTSFQALLAPLLIDNPTLERRVLESDLASELLADTGELDLVGLAVLPTRPRKPLGLSRPLVAAEDYRGARIGVREGGGRQGNLERPWRHPGRDRPRRAAGRPGRDRSRPRRDQGQRVQPAGEGPHRQRDPLAQAGHRGDQPEGV